MNLSRCSGVYAVSPNSASGGAGNHALLAWPGSGFLLISVAGCRAQQPDLRHRGQIGEYLNAIVT